MAARARPPSTKDQDETLVIEILSRALGVTVCRHDNNSQPSMYDLAAVLPDGRDLAVEVISTRDRLFESLHNATSQYRYNLDARLRAGWYVTVGVEANIKRAKKDLPGALLALEVAGVRDAGLDVDRVPVAAASVLAALDVRVCVVSDVASGMGPGFWIFPRTRAFFHREPDYVALFAGSFLAESAQADVAKKLNASGAAERHAAIVLTRDQLAHQMIVGYDDELPSKAPTLPIGITGLWLMSLGSDARRALSWAQATGWVSIDLRD